MDNFSSKMDKLQDLQTDIVNLFKDTLDNQELHKNEVAILKAKNDMLVGKIRLLEQKNEKLLEREENCENCVELRHKLNHAETAMNNMYANWAALKTLVNNDDLYERLTKELFCMHESSPELQQNNVLFQQGPEIDSQFFLQIADDMETAQNAEVLPSVPENPKKRRSEELLELLFGTPKPHISQGDVVPQTVATDIGHSDVVPETVPALVSPRHAHLSPILQAVNEKTPRKLTKSQENTSPVLRIMGNARKLDDRCKENVPTKHTEQSPLRLTDQRLLLKSVQPACSPVKRLASLTSQMSPGKVSHRSPKRMKTSPGKRQSQLARCNAIEAVVTATGVKKLKQTVLNTELFIQRPKGKPEVNVMQYSEPIAAKGEELVLKVDADEDWLVPNSPNVKTFPPPSRLPDTEETFVSRSVLEQHRHKVKLPVQITGSSTYDRLPDTEDDCSHPYQRGAVRKKADRMKLPGHDCVECQQYYKTFGMDCAAVVNKCSRHRNKYLPPDTPPGFWKPYFSPTLPVSSEDVYP